MAVQTDHTERLSRFDIALIGLLLTFKIAVLSAFGWSLATGRTPEWFAAVFGFLAAGAG